MPPPSRKRWWVCGMLFLATVIGYIDRQAMAVAAPVIAREFSLNNEMVGRILAAFLFAYGFGQLAAGRFLDWVGSRLGFALAIGWWSLANCLTATVTRPWGFTLFRFLLGVGESGNFPGGAKLITEWFPPHERAFAGGLFASGGSVGAVVAAPLVAMLVHHFGWRAAFVITGGVGFVWLAAWLAFYRSPPARVAGTAPAIGLRQLVRVRQVWALTLGRMLEEPVLWMAIFWLPKYMVDVRHVPLLETGWLLVVPFLALDAGYVSGGWIAGRLMRRGWSARRAKLTVMFAAAALMTGLIPAALASGLAVFLAGVSAAVMGHGMWFANVLSMPADLAPSRAVASFYGITGAGGAIGGMLVTEAAGIVADRFGTFTPLFLWTGTMPLVATALVLWLGRGRPAWAAEEP